MVTDKYGFNQNLQVLKKGASFEYIEKHIEFKKSNRAEHEATKPGWPYSKHVTSTDEQPQYSCLGQQTHQPSTRDFNFIQIYITVDV